MNLEFCSFFQIFDFLDCESALILAGLPERELVFEALYKAVDQRVSLTALYKVDPMFDSLNPDSRYDDLPARMNLPHSNSN
jgi:hypothetical protein